MPDEEEPQAPARRTLLVRDVLDGQLRSREGRRIGRVSEIEAEWTPRGLYLRQLRLGPEANLGRVFGPLSDLLHRFTKGRHEHTIPITEAEEIGPNVFLKQTSDKYDTGNADEWIRDHIFRFIPGSDK
jgi:hypothetical protein